MRRMNVAIADVLYEALEKTFQPEEIDIFINQAIRRQLEDLYARTGKEPLADPPPQEDENNHEWAN